MRALAIVLVLLTTTARCETIWFAPIDRDNTAQGIGSTDYAEMFAPAAPWKPVYDRLSVFKLYPFFAGRAPDEALLRVIGFTRRHNIALALEGRVLTDTPTCKGDGGINTPRLLARIKKLGGRVDILAMDEPMKHWFYGKSACHASPEALARTIVANVRAMRAIFPAMQVGDIEPVGSFPEDPDLPAHLMDVLDAYVKVAGEPLAFFHADVIWTKPWLRTLVDVGERLRRKKIPFGVIYNGEDLATTDRIWSDQARRNAAVFEHAFGVPDTAVFQSWVAHPTRILPSSDSDTLSGIAFAYVRAH